jgi:hypothetical protein
MMAAGSYGPPKVFDVRKSAEAFYSGKTRPLRLFVGVVGLILAGIYAAGLVLRGLGTLNEILGIILLAYEVFTIWAIFRGLTLGPVELKIYERAFQLAWQSGRVVSVDLGHRGNLVELFDLSSTKRNLARRTDQRAPWFIRLDSWSLFALSKDALEAMRAHLEQAGLRPLYDGSVPGLSGGRTWRFSTA